MHQLGHINENLLVYKTPLNVKIFGNKELLLNTTQFIQETTLQKYETVLVFERRIEEIRI